jgi:hypothetical protein
MHIDDFRPRSFERGLEYRGVRSASDRRQVVVVRIQRPPTSLHVTFRQIARGLTTRDPNPYNSSLSRRIGRVVEAFSARECRDFSRRAGYVRARAESALKQRVDEWRDRRAVRKHNQAAKQGENHKDWNEPKLFPLFQVKPKVRQEFHDHPLNEYMTQECSPRQKRYRIYFNGARSPGFPN